MTINSTAFGWVIVAADASPMTELTSPITALVSNRIMSHTVTSSQAINVVTLESYEDREA
jgi:hypothetical protein